MADREPIGGTSRPTGEMQSVRSLASRHASHDLLLLAAATDRGADPTLRTAAAQQAAECTECGALAADLRSLAGDLADLPRSIPAPRDMRLTTDQAARLGRGRIWRRRLRPFGADGLPGLRPLAATLTTLGLAGILLTAIPFGFGFGSGGAALSAGGGRVDNGGAAAPGEAAYSGAPVPAVASAGTADLGSDMKGLTSAPAASAAARDSSAFGPAEGGDELTNTPHAYQLDEGGVRVAPLTWVSLGLVVVGIGLFGVLLLARRIV